MRWSWVLGLLIVTAGCLSGAGEQTRLTPQEAAQLDEDELEEVERQQTFETEVTASAGQGRIEGVQWPVPLAPGLTELSVELAWQEEAHAFGVDVEGPAEAKIEPEQDPTGAQRSAEIADPAPGTYVFYPTRNGVVTSDTLSLTVTATFAVPADDALAMEGCSEIHAHRRADGWRASFACQASGPASAEKRVDADTVNGGVALDGDADGALASVRAWAEGDTEHEARERARSIDVTVQVTDDELVARAQAPDWEDRGADAEIGVEQARLTGRADTTNGPITFANVQVEGFSADTTNGPIRGEITGGGDLAFDTTNGAIDLAFTPEERTRLEADTTNGRVDLGLTETSRIAYAIDAGTTNGKITENMDEARLDGSEDEARLVTEDGDGRPIRVTGDADTTNGDIHFEGR